MTKLFLAPCASERPQNHFRNSVQRGVLSALYKEHTDRNFGSEVSMWGVTPGLESTWSKIGPEDVLLFYFGNREYRYAAEVLDTEQNLDLGLEIWPDYRDKSAGGGDTTDPWKYLIYLDDPVEIRLNSELLHERAGHARTYPFKFAPYPEDRYDTLLEDCSSVQSFIQKYEVGVESEFGDSKAIQTTDQEEDSRDLRPPKRTETTISRIIRNTQLSKEMKERYNYECQVCGLRLQRSSGEPYAEAHHLHPLGDSPPGLDVEENIIVLCPNHHAEFDYGAIRIDEHTYELEHGFKNYSGKQLDINGGHNLEVEYLRYHNEEIAKF